ncbi:MAG: DUF3793 family protein [Bacillota bacterium]|nr:DUF3793 family protein [Bacillota bacterium]MDW7683247.1 DUF3793 family protein [Bacillota bacterium]
MTILKNVLVNEFMRRQQTLDERSRLLATIAFCAAPTIAAGKPATLISFTGWNRNLLQAWDRYREELRGLLPLNYFELKRTTDRALVLFYRQDRLQECIREKGSAGFLREYGYDETDFRVALHRLRSRTEKALPHEVGIFLGFPAEDVEGYIKNKGKNYLLQRYWKVYHKPKRALRLFAAYDRTKLQMLSLLNNV